MTDKIQTKFINGRNLTHGFPLDSFHHEQNTETQKTILGTETVLLKLDVVVHRHLRQVILVGTDALEMNFIGYYRI